ncbi:pesticin C-terminus-like muramidase [Pseudoalteromonas obscura]|uniref:Pesticin C-terminus-like muramidase n=1 Tax=Pseudoalteromonas obscura TaxID=3048491 RepID=A0ABT7ES66_9GAMM|nr:pesticin C-terminus-like muramidase [Pseudoalteromonas sp. P94(2023)]MDK2597901.1 pesticin C-terminus-like muramidase [Pseudoalteromonas sp. P94(2023)]
MALNINYAFIAGLEGGQHLTGYVPDAAGSRSGVTIATGFDIGQRSKMDLSWLLPGYIASLLSPYCGLTGEAATRAVADSPLVINASDAQVIDLCTKARTTELLIQRFDRAAITPFEQLPEPAQTVIASVAYQYGDLASRCPRFWHFATTLCYADMVRELRNFGDRYPSRRRQEADYLERGYG